MHYESVKTLSLKPMCYISETYTAKSIVGYSTEMTINFQLNL